MSRAVFVAVVAVLIFFAYRLSLPRDEASAPEPAGVPLPVGTLNTADLAFLLTQTPPRTIPTPNPEAVWAERASLVGTENGRSEPFELTGNLARLRYSLDSTVTILALSVIPDGVTGFAGFPDVMATQVGQSERLILRTPGRYRLVVQSVGGNWTAAVEEEELPAMEAEAP